MAEDCQSFAAVDTTIFSLLENAGNTAGAGLVGSAGDEETLVRLVGELTWSVFVHNVTSNGVIALQVDIFQGIYLVDEDDLGNVIVRSPALAVDQESKDWLWRNTVSFSSLTRDPVNDQELPPATFEVKSTHIDIRVMRKIRPREVLVLACQPVTDEIFGSAISVPTVSLVGNVRALMMSA